MHISRRSFFGGTALAMAGSCTSVRAASVAPGLPTLQTCDVCVLGGSATGVFAAVRAARLGARVALIEKTNAFGGVATNGLVNVWHSLLDNAFQQPIIGGLTQEVMERLKKRDAVRVVEKNASEGFIFNSQELKIELDELILECKTIKPYLHTLFSEPYVEEGKLVGVIVDNKSGRGIIRAQMFVDATGDGDLCHRLNVPSYTYDQMQPPTVCAHFSNFNSHDFTALYAEHAAEVGLPAGFFWGTQIPGSSDFMMAGTRVYGRNCADADDLTAAEMEGRRQVRLLQDLSRKYGKQALGLTALPAMIGIRDTRHIRCQHQLTDQEAMNGVAFPDTIAKGSYRFDLHHQEKPGLTFYYLDGRKEYHCPGKRVQRERWREAAGAATYYQIPLRSLLPQGQSNVIMAGRMLDAEKLAFSGVRVMVNMNQLGEAAGVACVVALQNKQALGTDVSAIRETLRAGGSLL